MLAEDDVPLQKNIFFILNESGLFDTFLRFPIFFELSAIFSNIMLILSSPQITIIKPLFNYYISQTRTQVKSFGKLTLSKFICIVVDKKKSRG